MYPLALHKRHRRTNLIFQVVLLTALVIAVWTAGYYTYEYYSRGRSYDELIAAAAARNGIDSLLLKAVIRQESGFDCNARGSAGEIGLMQIMPGTAGAAKDWADAHRVPLPSRGLLFNPALNIEIGSWYLARALRRWSGYKSALELALCEYNAGISKARAWKPPTYDGDVMNRINYRSTRAYVEAITDRYDQLRQKRENER